MLLGVFALKEREEFQQIYQDLKLFYNNSGDLASALLPFIAHTGDIKLAVTMLHTQIQTFDDLRVGG